MLFYKVREMNEWSFEWDCPRENRGYSRHDEGQGWGCVWRDWTLEEIGALFWMDYGITGEMVAAAPHFAEVYPRLAEVRNGSA